MCLPKYCALFSKPNVLGVASLVQLPGVGVPDVGHQTLAPRGEMPEWCDPPPIVCCLVRVGSLGEGRCLSFCPTWSFYLLLWRTAVPLESGLFSEGNDPYTVVNLVCLHEEARSGSPYAAILDSAPDTFKSGDLDSNLAVTYFKLYYLSMLCVPLS